MRLRLRVVLTRYDYQPVELTLCILTTLWGIWVSMPWNTFEATPIYRSIGGSGAEPLWGLVFLAVGVTGIFALLCRHISMRLWCARLIGAGWGILAVGAGFGAWQSTAMPIDTCLAIISLWVQFRLSVWHDRVRDSEMGNAQ